jgi:uncharacterized membrane protein
MTQAKQAAQYTFSAANSSRAMTVPRAQQATRTQARIHRVFEIGLVLKAVHSVLEIVGGILLLAVSQERMLRIANLLTQEELLRDPHYRIAALITYQSYRLLHGLSIGLAALTVLDAVVLLLTWHEYRVVRATPP